MSLAPSIKNCIDVTTAHALIITTPPLYTLRWEVFRIQMSPSTDSAVELILQAGLVAHQEMKVNITCKNNLGCVA